MGDIRRNRQVFLYINLASRQVAASLSRKGNCDIGQLTK